MKSTRSLKLALMVILLTLFLVSFLSAEESDDKRVKMVILKFNVNQYQTSIAEDIYKNFVSSLITYRQFNIVSKRNLTKVLKKLKYDEKKKLTDEDALKIAKNSEAGLVLTGSVIRDGVKLKLYTRILDVAMGSIVFEDTRTILMPTQVPNTVRLIAGDIIEETFAYSVDADKIAIIDFTKGDLDEKISDLFNRKLKAAIPTFKQYRLVDNTELLTVLREFDVTTDTVLDEDTALQICEKLQVIYLVYGSIRKDGSNYIVDAKAINLADKELVYRKLFTTTQLSQLPELSDAIAKNISYEDDIYVYDDDEMVNLELKNYERLEVKFKKTAFGLFMPGVLGMSLGIGCMAGMATTIAMHANGMYSNRIEAMYLDNASVILGVIGSSLLTLGLVPAILSIYYYTKYRKVLKQKERVSFTPVIGYYDNMASLGVSIRF